ncbi:aminotransferase like protein [Zymoseptoria brevis]|uniref:Aminotransferase like protein n=1 Tax=Zymoseptoria brevis TaxID=1047168 RepID=A0A0F4GVG7_9PEZI|nr:aminotransferase like protein [Zymoseptoria brevis]
MSITLPLRLIKNLLWPDKTTRQATTNNMMSSEKEQINLLRGWPSRALLPLPLIRAAAVTVLSDPTIALDGLLYGPDEGYLPCREAVAAWLTTFYRPTHRIPADRICISGGASQNLGNILNVFTDPEYTRHVWFVTPAYMLAFRIFEDAGFAGKMRAVPEDDQGVDVEYLRRDVRRSEEVARREGNVKPRFKPERKRAKVFRHVLYCVPSFSNPSSRTMSLKRRTELVRLAREFDMLIMCDDVYDMLQWPVDGEGLIAMETAHLPRLVDIDREIDGGAERDDADGFGNVVSNGTFSKIAGPGMRVGWAEGTSKFAYGLGQAGVQRSGGAPSQLTSIYLTHLLNTGQLQNHIHTVLRPAYASRYKAMLTAIETHLLSLGFTLPQPDRDVVGGYFLWLGLPGDMQATDLTTRCQKEENLIVAPGGLFQIPGDDAVLCAQNVRLCFAWEDEEKLVEGVRRIGEVARRLSKGEERASEEYVLVDGNGEDEPEMQSYM